MERDQQLRQLTLGGREAAAVLFQPSIAGARSTKLLALDNNAPDLLGQRLRRRWLSHSDSTPPMLVYWFCIISRGYRLSRLFAGEGTTPPAPVN